MTIAEERVFAFKVGFMRKLAELGILPDEFFSRVKAAGLEDLPEAALGGAIDVGKSAVGAGLGLAGGGLKALGGAALLAPVIAGGATGAASGYLEAPTPQDIDVMRKAELLKLYERLTHEVAERKLRRAS